MEQCTNGIKKPTETISHTKEFGEVNHYWDLRHQGVRWNQVTQEPHLQEPHNTSSAPSFLDRLRSQTRIPNMTGRKYREEHTKGQEQAKEEK